MAESWCGSAFSFFDWTATPLSEFCVERLPAPATAAPPAEHGGVEGYTRYLSCNAPEAAVVHNDKRDPVTATCLDPFSRLSQQLRHHFWTITPALLQLHTIPAHAMRHALHSALSEWDADWCLQSDVVPDLIN